MTRKFGKQEDGIKVDSSTEDEVALCDYEDADTFWAKSIISFATKICFAWGLNSLDPQTPNHEEILEDVDSCR
jgi:hypothetical protein